MWFNAQNWVFKLKSCRCFSPSRNRVLIFFKPPFLITKALWMLSRRSMLSSVPSLVFISEPTASLCSSNSSMPSKKLGMLTFSSLFFFFFFPPFFFFFLYQNLQFISFITLFLWFITYKCFKSFKSLTVMYYLSITSDFGLIEHLHVEWFPYLLHKTNTLHIVTFFTLHHA